MVGPLRTFRPFSRFPKPNLPTDQSPAPYSGYSEGWPANLASNKSLAGRCMRWSPCYCSGRNPHARKPRLSGSSNDGPFSLSSSELSRALVGVMHQSIEVLYFCGVAGVSSPPTMFMDSMEVHAVAELVAVMENLVSCVCLYTQLAGCGACALHCIDSQLRQVIRGAPVTGFSIRVLLIKRSGSSLIDARPGSVVLTSNVGDNRSLTADDIRLFVAEKLLENSQYHTLHVTNTIAISAFLKVSWHPIAAC